ncbi:hypothetical protein TcCL_ESM11718, partial [Trypanosoma cruzi]
EVVKEHNCAAGGAAHGMPRSSAGFEANMDGVCPGIYMWRSLRGWDRCLCPKCELARRPCGAVAALWAQKLLVKAMPLISLTLANGVAGTVLGFCHAYQDLCTRPASATIFVWGEKKRERNSSPVWLLFFSRFITWAICYRIFYLIPLPF